MTDRKTRLRYYNKYWQSDISKYGDGIGDRQRVRYQLVTQSITRQKGAILDVGCGNGQGSLLLQNPGFTLTGVDLSEIGVSEAQKRGVNAFVCDLETDEIPGKYDVIVCMEVLEHVQFPLEILKKLKNNLNPKGELIISLPNEFHLLRRLQILVGRQDFSQYDFPHLRFFDRKEAYRLIRDAGYTLEKEIGVPLPPPRMRFLTNLFGFLLKFSPQLFTIGFIFRITPD